MNPLTRVFSRTPGIETQDTQPSRLPFRTQSLCPECLEVIDAVIGEDDGNVFMDKTCPNHGHFREIISNDPKFYQTMLNKDNALSKQVSNPVPSKGQCPNGCGICENHKSQPVMVNIDLTNRCNLNCPICFANSKASGKVIELNRDQINSMLDNICQVNDVKPACLQYTGGEPTIHPHFLDALDEASKRGFTQIQVATNGLKFANDPGFAQAASEAGLNIVYLQFDALDDDIWKKVRGRPLNEIKKRAIDNLYEAGIRTILVPTIVKGVNDGEIGSILDFAIQHIDKVTAISWQPVAFTGRIDYQKRIAQRFTLTDLATEIEKQTGMARKYRNWYPFSFADPFTRLVHAVTGEKQQSLGCHPGCGIATYLIVNTHTREAVTIPEFVDVVGLMEQLSQAERRLRKKKLFKRMSVARELRSVKKYFNKDKAPRDWDFDTFLEFMLDFVYFSKKYVNNQVRRRNLEKKSYRPLLLASMHFQDAYNYQIDRVKRCVIHYAGPNGRIYPFCTWNSGPCHRTAIEQEYAVKAASPRK